MSSKLLYACADDIVGSVRTFEVTPAAFERLQAERDELLARLPK